MNTLANLLLSLLLCATPAWAGIDFDGTDDFVDCDSPASLDSFAAFTMAAWVNIDSLAGDEFAVISKGGGSCVPSCDVKMLAVGDWFGNSDRLVVFIHTLAGNGNSTSANNTMTTGAWTHIAATWAGVDNAAKLYKNGVEVSYANQDAPTGTIADDSDKEFTIAARDNSGSFNLFFNGRIDDVCVWNDDLTANEVAQLALSRTRRMCLQVLPSALVLYQPMDDGPDASSADGDTLDDLSSQANNCTGNDGAGNANLTWTGGQVLSYP